MSHLALHLVVDALAFASGILLGGYFVAERAQRNFERARRLLMPETQDELDAAVELAKVIDRKARRFLWLR